MEATHPAHPTLANAFPASGWYTTTVGASCSGPFVSQSRARSWRGMELEIILVPCEFRLIFNPLLITHLYHHGCIRSGFTPSSQHGTASLVMGWRNGTAVIIRNGGFRFRNGTLAYTTAWNVAAWASVFQQVLSSPSWCSSLRL